MTRRRSTIIFSIGFSWLLLVIFTIGVEEASVFGSTEISRTYEKTVSSSSSSIYKSLTRNLDIIDDLKNQEANATYRVQFDEEGRRVINVTVIDYAEPFSPRITVDDCGDGSNQFTTNNGGVRWMEFPVTFAVNPSNSGLPSTATINAFVAAFKEFDTRMPGQAFLQTTNFDSADFRVGWQFIDGQGGQLGTASWTYIPSTLEITSASITLDSGDSWFVASSESCGQNGNLFDIQDVGSHELGHAVGLGHVNDNLLTMYPNSFAGETLKRSLGTGDNDGLRFLYGTVQRDISSLTARPTNNIVNTNSFYDVVFLTATTGTIKKIEVTFPAGTIIPIGAFFNEAEGIGPGTVSKSGQTITYTVNNAVSIPVGTKIRLEFANINNPLQVSSNYKVTVTTRDAANAIIDGPSGSTAYTIKQIGTNAIADNSITSTKPNEGFMKRVTLQDNAAGNARGWDPNGIAVSFSIADPGVSGIDSAYVSLFVIGGGTPDCRVTTASAGQFGLTCEAAPGNGAELHYIVKNLPSHVNGGDAGLNDKFGIKKIYASKRGGEEWFMDMQDPANDPRTNPPPMSQNADGSWRVTSGQVRYGVFTSSGYHPDQVVKDHSILATRGYMQSPNDWKNVEMTGQVKFNSGGDDEWTWYARGGRHTGNGWPDGCEGSSLKGMLEYTSGRVRWAKEQWHVSFVFVPWQDSPASADGKFVGFKAVMYNFQLNGETAVKLEIWVDPNNNNQWQKVYDLIDQGGWGSEGEECFGAPDQIITWGGPIATFRWDDGESIDIKNLSVREIAPPTQ